MSCGRDPLVYAVIKACNKAIDDLGKKWPLGLIPIDIKMNAFYILLIGGFRVCSIRGNKKDLKHMAKEMYDGLLEEINE